MSKKTVESQVASIFLLAEAMGIDVQKLIEEADSMEKTLSIPEEQTVEAEVYTATTNESAASGGRE